MVENPEYASIELGERQVTYRLHRRRRRRLSVAVSPDLSVDVYAPLSAGRSRIAAFLSEKAAWIAKSLQKFEGYHRLPAPKDYCSGETLMYLGRAYALKVENGPRRPAQLTAEALRVWDEPGGGPRRIKAAVDAWYREQAKEVFARTLAMCLPAAARQGIPAPRLFVRAMRTRWGSCSGSGRITLSTHLVQVPPELIAYVVMHELCHLKHPNHSGAFYGLLSLCLPDWRPRKAALARLVVS
jgi:hypothetical protein